MPAKKDEMREELERLAVMAAVAKDEDDLDLRISGDALRYLIGGAQTADAFLGALGSTAARFSAETDLDPTAQQAIVDLCLAIAENPVQVLQENRAVLTGKSGAVSAPEKEDQEQPDENIQRFSRMDL